MVHYRLYFISPLSGHISRAEDMDAVDDRQAMDMVDSLDAKQPLELWCNVRRVHRIDAPLSQTVPTAMLEPHPLDGGADSRNQLE